MPSIFISYSRVDQEFAVDLASELTDAGADVWLDLEDIAAGVNWSQAIQQGLDECDALLILLSPESMASENVRDEWQYAKDQGTVLIPILWRPTNVHFQLHRLQYIDFHSQDFDIAFRQLRGELRRHGLDLPSTDNGDESLPAHQKPLDTQEADVTPPKPPSIEPAPILSKTVTAGDTRMNKSVQRPTSTKPKRGRSPWLALIPLLIVAAVVIAAIALNSRANPDNLADQPAIVDRLPTTTVSLAPIFHEPATYAEPFAVLPPRQEVIVTYWLYQPENDLIWYTGTAPSHPEWSVIWIEASKVALTEEERASLQHYPEEWGAFANGIALIEEPSEAVILYHLTQVDNGIHFEAEPITWFFGVPSVRIEAQVSNANNPDDRWYLAEIPQQPELLAWLPAVRIVADLSGDIPMLDHPADAESSFNVATERVELGPYLVVLGNDGEALEAEPSYIGSEKFEVFTNNETPLEVYLMWYDDFTIQKWLLARDTRNGRVGWINSFDVHAAEGNSEVTDTLPDIISDIPEELWSFYPVDVQEHLHMWNARYSPSR
ncbi:MAG: TIR domain-containing protein [Anaerolineaceae bacterium]|nr:TIR domain-containing protein [Anaerolineaceae bacterium]